MAWFALVIVIDSIQRDWHKIECRGPNSNRHVGIQLARDITFPISYSNFLVLIKLYKAGLEILNIFAIEAFETFFFKRFFISSSLPSSLDFPKVPLGLPNTFPLARAAARPSLVRSEIKSLSISANKPNIELDDRISDYKIQRDDKNKPNLEVVGVFSETGSGWTPEERPVFEELVKYVCNNKTIKHVLFVWANRMGRNFEDYIDFKKRLRKANPDVHLHFIKEELVLQPLNKSDYKDEERLEDVIKKGKAFSGELSERITEARKDRFEQGRIAHMVCYGYINKHNPEPPYDTYIEIVPAHAERVKKIFEMRASGLSSLSTAKELERRGWTKRTYKRSLKRYIEEPFSKGYIDYMLQNEFYLGKAKRLGESKSSKHVPQIIDEALFEKVQNVKGPKKSQPEKTKGKYSSPVANLCKCHFCGCQITTDRVIKKYKNGKEQTFIYLRCTNGKIHRDANWYKRKFNKNVCIQPYNTEKGIVEAIDKEVEKLWFHDDVLVWLEGELENLRKDSKKVGAKIKDDLEAKLAKLNHRKSQINVMRADAELTKEEFLEMKNAVLKEIESVENELEELQDSDLSIEDEIEITIDIMSRLQEKWTTLSIKDKAEVLRIMAKKITLGKDGKNKPEIQWDMPWSFFYKVGSRGPNEIGSIEQGWHARRDLNPRPLDSKSTALSAELRAHLQCKSFILID